MSRQTDYKKRKKSTRIFPASMIAVVTIVEGSKNTRGLHVATKTFIHTQSLLHRTTKLSMTPTPHTEFGNEWPGLFPERRDEIDLNIIRKAAKAFKYEEWYYRSKCKGQYVVAAFRKKDFNDSGDEIRFQVFPTNWAIGVCYIHGDEYRNENGTNNSNDTGNEQIENEIEFFRKNKKSTFVHNVSSEVMVIDLLEDPLGNHQYLQQMECPVTNLNIFTRYDNFADLWKPVVHPSNR